MSGVGTRRFCGEQGLAVSTFGLWRKKFTARRLERVCWL
ncbi:IS66 family insertion sequence element accessory protein TnpA [Caballeronia calidae]